MKETETVNYNLLCDQIRALAEISNDWVPVLANASALLYDAMDDINWAGFYMVRDISGQAGTAEDSNGKALILGPFQGRPACVRIEHGKGVCGTAWALDETQLVPNVHEFPGHIACDSASNSEIVIPIHAYRCDNWDSVDDSDNLDGAGESAGNVIGVLDIDSPSLDRFTEEDRAGLTEFVRTLEIVANYDNCIRHNKIPAVVRLREDLKSADTESQQFGWLENIDFEE